MGAVFPGSGVPEDAPGWAIRLEAKLDVAIAQHGQAIETLSREVDTLRRDRERSEARLEAVDRSIDERVDALERSPFVTTKGLAAALTGTVAVLAGLAALIDSLSSIL